MHKKITILILFFFFVAHAQAGYLDPNATVPTSTPLQPMPENTRPNLENNINSGTVEENQEAAGDENTQFVPEGERGWPGNEGEQSGQSEHKNSGTGAVNGKVFATAGTVIILILVSYGIYNKRSRR